VALKKAVQAQARQNQLLVAQEQVLRVEQQVNQQPEELAQELSQSVSE
jgi:hypothetical protein